MKMKASILIALTAVAFALFSSPAAGKEVHEDNLLQDPYFLQGFEALDNEEYELASKLFKSSIKMNKRNYYSWLMLAEAEAGTGDCKKALRTARKAYKLFKDIPDNELMLLDYAKRELICEGDSIIALKLIRKCTASGDSDIASDAFNTLGRLALSRNDTLTATRYYVNALAVMPTAENYIHLAFLYPEHSDKRIEYLENARHSDGDDWDLFSSTYNLFDEYIYLEDYEKAANVIVDATLIWPDSMANWIDKIREQHPEVLKKVILGRINKEDEDNHQYIYPLCLAKIYLDLSQPEEALPYALTAYRIHPDATTAGYVFDCYQSLNDYPMALKFLDMAETDELSFPGIRAVIIGALGNYDEALELYEKEENGPDSVPIYSVLNQSLLLMDMERYEDALPLLEKINKETEYSFLPTVIREADAYKKLGRTELARAGYNKALEIIRDETNLDSTGVQATLPIVLYELGDIAGAENAASGVWQNDEDDPSILYETACYYCRKGETQKGMDLLRKAIEKGYDPYHASRDYDLKSLRGIGDFDKIINEGKMTIRERNNALEKKSIY